MTNKINSGDVITSSLKPGKAVTKAVVSSTPTIATVSTKVTQSIPTSQGTLPTVLDEYVTLSEVNHKGVAKYVVGI